MKTSKKIVIATGSFLVIILIGSLFVMRNDMLTILERSSVVKYKSVSVDYFEEIEFSGNWKVRIKPGRVCEVQVEAKNDTFPKPRLEKRNGKQLFITKAKNEVVHAKVSVPLLKKVIASHGAKIHIQDYPADSILIELKDSSSFTGKNNQFGTISFKTSGEASIQITETMN